VTADLEKLVSAICRMEGSDQPYSVNRTMVRLYGLHNPGHLVWAEWLASQTGAVRVTINKREWSGWPTDDAGREAIGTLLTKYCKWWPGLTIGQAIEHYAPSNENNTARYKALVAEWTGLPIDRKLIDVVTPPKAEGTWAALKASITALLR
jgi:hypothetical protein